MSYLVTGATGFIGQQLVQRLAKRKGTIFVLVRKRSEKKLEPLRKKLGLQARRLQVIHGDIAKKNCGVTAADLKRLNGKVKMVFHLAAVYDLQDSDTERQMKINVEGTRHVVKLAESIGAESFNHMSSIAAAGRYRGYFREDMFEEAVLVDQPYFVSKHKSEAVVRRECTIPWRVFRPGIVVGHSKTGEINKVDGPYYLFPFLKKLRRALPPWFPLIGPEGARINIVPVDYVVRATDFLAHKRGLAGRCFHLTDPNPKRAGELTNVFARAAGAPEFTMRIDARMMNFIPQGIRDSIMELPPIRRIIDGVMHDLGLPPMLLSYIDYPTRFDCHDTQKALHGSGIVCPPVEDYAPMLWDYWKRNLDPDLFRDHTLKGAVKGKVVVITGASSGIGRAAALRVAAAGAKTIIIARTLAKLKEVKQEIEAAGGRAFVYTADVSDTDACEKVMKKVLKEHGQVDVLVNNAGKSIRRSVQLSFDRFHDYERLMRINYFGAVRLILGVLPSMVERKSGHIVNVSSIGVLANSPRFSAYVASKSALDAFSRCVRAELHDKNIRFTTINMPLVRTPMIGPTKLYDHVPVLTPDEAADMVCDAIIYRPRRIATRLGVFAGVMTTLLPGVADVILNTAYKLFPESSAAARSGDDAPAVQEAEPSTEAVIFASIMRGVYW